jgi:hypothetical protein
MVRGQWVNAGGRAGNKPRSEEKIAITTACDSLIADVLLPKYLPEITPSEYNYPIAIYGKWHGNKYRFITRYRSDRQLSQRPAVPEDRASAGHHPQYEQGRDGD